MGLGGPWLTCRTSKSGVLGGVGTALDLRARPLVVGIRRTGRTSQRSGFPSYIVRRIEELIENDVEGGGDISELASSVGYSPSHFSRMFRRSFGITPHTYLMQRRVAAAQELLVRTDLRLTEIALKAGFCDQSHFSRAFRQFVGLAPRAFRTLNR